MRPESGLSIYEFYYMKAYRITTPFWAESGKVGGSAYAIQPHREVRPESGLSVYEVYDMKACRILTPFWAIGEGDEEEEEKGRGRQGASYDHSSYRIVGVRIYPLTLALALAQHLVRWGEEEVKGGGGVKGIMSTTRSHSPTNSDCSRA